MCGFIASFGDNFKKSDFNNAMNHLKRRGPDAQSTWSDKSVFLGSTRLAIFDLNERSNQPMSSICEKYILVFNGAIYNYKSLRNFLLKKGVKLKTFSDTEVILELYALEGKKMLHRLEGMFSFVIWNKKNKEGFAARDPYGIKPLYIGSNLNNLVLSSQVKAILSTNKFDYDRDNYSNFSFNNFGYIIEPRTWFKSIKSLESGNYIIIRQGKIVEKKKWYNLDKLWVEADNNNNKIEQNKYEKIIKKILTKTVKKHLIADVPIGILLSGGVDSALLSLIASSNTKKNITAITVLFEDFKNSKYDETLEAEKIAKSIGIKHHIFRVTQKDFNNDLPRILEAMDQPSIDGINTWYASKAASNLKIKVIFSGLGGDEIFFGYDHYKKIPMFIKISKYFKKIPFLIMLSNFILNLISLAKKDTRWKFILKNSNSIFYLWFLKRSIGYSKKDKSNIKKAGKINFLDFYKQLLNEDIIFNFKNLKIQLSQLDSVFYMRNQLLRDSDWASMYHGVELRTPFVDVKLFEEISKLMGSYSIHKNKEVLKYSFQNNKVFDKIFLSKKKGFQTPILNWYKNKYVNENISKKNYINYYMSDIKSYFNKISK